VLCLAWATSSAFNPKTRNVKFFIVVVGDNKNKYFKVKTRFFNQLFGPVSRTEYAALKKHIRNRRSGKKLRSKQSFQHCSSGQSIIEIRLGRGLISFSW